MDFRTYEQSGAAIITFPKRPLGHLSPLDILPDPIPAGPWLFRTVEHLLQAAKFPSHPDYQEFISSIRNGSHAIKESGWGPPYDREAWEQLRVPLARWAIRAALESNPEPIRSELDETGDKPIVLDSVNLFWGARNNVRDHTLTGTNALGRLWQELRTQLRNNDPLVSAKHWRNHLGTNLLGRIAEPPSANATLLVDLPHPCNNTRPTPRLAKLPQNTAPAPNMHS